jgi:serine/threonine protein kinase
MLEEKSIYLVFEYAEHDFLVRYLDQDFRSTMAAAHPNSCCRLKQIIHHHSSTRTQLPLGVLKSLMWQLTNGVSYLHDNWIIHRDLKPANILVNEKGQVKIGDLGLARLYQEPLQSLYTSDKVSLTRMGYVRNTYNSADAGYRPDRRHSLVSFARIASRRTALHAVDRYLVHRLHLRRAPRTPTHV